MKRSADKPALLSEFEQDYERVERELSLARVADEVAVHDRHDPEAVADVCAGAILNVYELWERWPVEAKSRVQRLVFPEGLGHEELVGNRTPRISLLYAAISESKVGKANMAPHVGRMTNKKGAELWDEAVRWYETLNVLKGSGLTF